MARVNKFINLISDFVLMKSITIDIASSKFNFTSSCDFTIDEITALTLTENLSRKNLTC